jgi:hypothetical protein
MKSLTICCTVFIVGAHRARAGSPEHAGAGRSGPPACRLGGDRVVADGDGVVFVPATRAAEVVLPVSQQNALASRG